MLATIRWLEMMPGKSRCERPPGNCLQNTTLFCRDTGYQRDSKRRAAYAAVLVAPVGEVGERDVGEVLRCRVSEDGRGWILVHPGFRVHRHDGTVVDVHDRINVWYLLETLSPPTTITAS